MKASCFVFVGLLSFGAASFLPTSALGQTVIATIDLDDQDPNGVRDNPFGITLTPDGAHALVAIAGGFDDANTPVNENNKRVDVIEMDSLTVIGSLNTGFFPEDIAIRTDGSGNTERIYVTNSSDSSVSVFTGINSPNAVNTISLPAFSFPFGLAFAPDQDRLFVGTVGGAGDIHVIDTDPLSGNFEMVITTINVPGGHGRMAFDGPSRLIVPHSVLAPDFGHADAMVTILDPDSPATRTTFLLAAGGSFEYPGVQDCAVSSEGLAYLPVFGGPDDVFVIDVRAPRLVRAIDLGPLAEDLQHGIALREDEGLLMVTNFVQSTLTLIDVRTSTVLGEIAVGNEPNEVAFSADGTLALVTNQNSFSVSVVGEIPLSDVELSGPTFPRLLDFVSFEFAGGEFGQQTRLLLSLQGNESNPFENTTVDLTPPIKTRFTGTFDRLGTIATSPAQVPNNLNLVGRSFHLQAVTTFSVGTQVSSNPVTVVVQP